MREHRRRFISFLFFLVLSTYLVITDGFVMIPERRFSTAMLHANMPRSSSFVSSSADDKDVSNRVGNQDDRSIASNFPSRRNILLSSAMLCGALTGLSFQPQPARAELIQFPCEDGTLRNTYHFMRAGQSLLEEENLWGTNPMFLTNRENSISELGVEQVQQACQLLEQADLSLSRVQFPLAANAMDTADIVAHQLQIGRTQLMPEYTYMDQRGIGKWDMLSVGLQSTQDAVWAMDAQEAGKNGLDGGLPPLNDDGTANEMLGHQVTRLRQLLSLLESSCSGDSILLIFPDGTGPALLSCLIAGIPLNRVHELEYRPGELRMDIHHSSIQAMLPATPTIEYTAALQRGKEQLQILRNAAKKNPEALMTFKERSFLKEQAKEKAQDEAFQQAKRQRQLEAQEERDRRYRYNSEQAELKRQQRMEKGKSKGQRPAMNSKVQPTMSERDFVVTEIAALGVAAGLFGAMQNSIQRQDSADEDLASSATTDNDTKESPAPKSMVLPNDSPAVLSAAPIHGKSYTELQAMEDLVENAPFSIPEFASKQSQEEDDHEERVRMAEQAMDDYISGDDGADAFLSMLGDLLEEEQQQQQEEVY